MERQMRDDTCAICSQKYILSSFGIEIPESDLIKDAALNGEYAPLRNIGTSPEDTGNLLERNGISVHRYEGSMENLISELSQGHKVLVGIDSREIIFANNDVTRAVEKYRDVLDEEADHAVVVVDANTDYVDILDPADGNFKRVNAETFLDAWHDSRCFMIATDQSPEEYFSAQNNSIHSKEENFMDPKTFNNPESNSGEEYIDVHAIHKNPPGNISANSGEERIDVHAVHKDSAGNVYAVEADTTGDGKIDMVAMDTTGNGHMDFIALDTTGDGNFDTQSLDFTGTNTPDIIAQDFNGDGIPDAYLVDTNGDGHMDSVGIDRNADGFIDDVVALG